MVAGFDNLITRCRWFRNRCRRSNSHLPEQNQLREICGGRLTFDDHDGVADNITIDSSAIQRGGCGGTPNNTPVTGASVDGFFDIIQALPRSVS